MKIILIVLLSIFLFTAFAITFLALQFDPALFKPRIESALNERTGFDVSVRDLSVYLSLPCGITIAGLKVRDAKSHEELLSVPRVVLGVDLWSFFLRGRWVFNYLRFEEPEIYLAHRTDGSWNWQNLTESKLESGDQKNEAGDKAPILRIQRFIIQEGQLHFLDDSHAPPFAAEIYQINLRFERLGGEPAIDVSGDFNLGPGKNYPEWFLTGRYHPGMKFASIQIHDAQKSWEIKGAVDYPSGIPRFQGGLDINNVSINPSILAGAEGGERAISLEGIMTTAHLQGKFLGTHPVEWIKETSVRGTADIRDGALRNFNGVSAIFREMTELPGFHTLLEGQIPQDIVRLFQGGETPFQTLHAEFKMNDGQFSAEEIRLKHFTYIAKLKGSAGFLDKNLAFEGNLVLLEVFSDYITEKIFELNILKNEKGRIAIPFFIEGRWPEFSLKPNLRYITGRLGQGQQGQGGNVMRKLEKKTALFNEKMGAKK